MGRRLRAVSSASGLRSAGDDQRGFAFSQALPDSDIAVSRDRSLAHIAEIAAAVDLPVNADFAWGYGIEPPDVAESVTRCVATGVAGLSVEDSTGERLAPLYEMSLAVERIEAARDPEVGRQFCRSRRSGTVR